MICPYSRLRPSLLLLLSAVLSTPGPAGELAITGSTTVLPIAQTISRAYSDRRPDVKVTVSGGGSSYGIGMLIDHSADIANSSRFLTAEEIDRAMAQDNYLVPFRIAHDCILPVVHISNRLSNLSQNELKQIFAGDLINWQQLGGPDLAIQPISRDGTSGTRKVWDDVIMGQTPVAAAGVFQSSNNAVIETVSQNPGAIGYVGLGYLNASVKPLAVDGTMGSLQTTRDGSYPIGRPLFMFTRGWPEGVTLDFINFVLHPHQGQELVRKTGYIPLY